MLEELHAADAHVTAPGPQYHAQRGSGLALALAGVDDQQPLLLARGPRRLAARDRFRCRAELGPRGRLLGVVGIAAVVRRVGGRGSIRRYDALGTETMEDMRLHRLIGQQ